MKLIGSSASPYVRKVRIVMAEKKLDYRFIEENVWADDTTIATSNPLGKVPCLVMEGGEAVFDSRVIVEYLDTLSPVGRLIPTQGRERAEVKTWEALADGVMDAGVLARLEATWKDRRDGERSQAWIDRQLGKVHAGLKAMSQGLGEKPLLQRHPPEPVRRGGGLRPGLAGVPVSGNRMAHRASEPGAPARQAHAAAQLRGDPAPLKPGTASTWGRRAAQPACCPQKPKARTLRMRAFCGRNKKSCEASRNELEREGGEALQDFSRTGPKGFATRNWKTQHGGQA